MCEICLDKVLDSKTQSQELRVLFYFNEQFHKDSLLFVLRYLNC